MDTIKIECEKTKMIAHRGLSALEKENTMAAFIAAGNRSYYGIECDIHKTTDGKYVVIHDDNTQRVSGIDKIVEESTYDELQSIDLLDLNKQSKSYLKIPTLQEYVSCCKKYETMCIIEFKNAFNKEDIYEVINIIKELSYLEKTVFISFVMENLIAVREIYSDLKLQYLRSDFSNEIMDACRKYRFGLDIHYQALTKEIVEKLHYYKIEVNAWTVDNPIIALMLISWGIDYITTNILE